VKNVNESGRGAFQRGRFIHRRGRGGRSFRNQESHGARNQNFNFRGRGRSRGRSHRGYSNWRNNHANVQCYNCKEYGHFASDCSQHKFEDKNVNFAEKEIDYEEPALLLACGKFDGSNFNTSYLDTGASNHMCGMKEAFVDIDESYKGNITFGDLSQRPVEERGRILIELKNGEQKFISEVFYVPDKKNNILSLGKFLEKGFEVQMKDKNLKIFDESGAAIASVKMTRNRMFPLDLSIYLSKCFKVEISNMKNLWHLRYGHLNCGCISPNFTISLSVNLPSYKG